MKREIYGLLESEELCRMMIKHSPDAVIIHSEDGILFANDATLKLVGEDFDSLQHKQVIDLIHPDFRDLALERIKRIYSEGKPSEFIHKKFVRKNNEIIDVEVIGILVDYRGKPAIQTIIRDISKHKKVERELIQSDRLYHLIANNTSDLICFFDMQGNFTYISPSHQPVLGYDPEELSGKNLFEFIHPNYIEEIRTKLSQLPENSRLLNYQLRFKNSAGEWRFLETTSNAVMNESGLPTGVVCISRDVTERIAAEAELKKLTEQLRRLAAHLDSVREQERMDLARDIHDIMGSSLAAIKMELSNLIEDIPESFQKEHPEITEKIEVMKTMTGDTISLMRNIIKRLRPEVLEELGLAEAIKWYINEIMNLTCIRFKICIIPEKFEVPEKISLVLFRMFQEIMTNVIHHSKADAVTVVLKKTETKFYLRVSDNGSGITREQMHRKDSFGILGLKERTHLLNGKIRISGIAGKGTRITLEIPVIS